METHGRWNGANFRIRHEKPLDAQTVRSIHKMAELSGKSLELLKEIPHYWVPEIDFSSEKNTLQQSWAPDGSLRLPTLPEYRIRFKDGYPTGSPELTVPGGLLKIHPCGTIQWISNNWFD